MKSRIPILRRLLLPFSWIFGGVVWFRHRLYDVHLLKSYAVGRATVSIGNLSAGGSGKTPVTLALAKLLQRPPYQAKVAILSRGYRRLTSGYQLVSAGEGPVCPWTVSGDEPQLIARKIEGAPVAVDGDRVRGAALLFQAFAPQILLLDDGFQHRRLRRDLDVVLLDTGRDLNDHLLPAGFLREPLASLSRAQIIALLAASAGDASLEPAWDFCSRKYGPERLAAVCLKPLICRELRTGVVIPLASLAAKRIIPFCGIAKPEKFLRSLEALGADMPYLIRFPDHHHYKAKDAERLATAYTQQRADYLLTTEKDAVKLEGLFEALPILVMEIEIVWLRGFENVARELHRVLGIGR